jgi:uncharacterized protein YegP (UPF0339 family)
MRTRITIFEYKAGEWRWHLQAPNGRIIATSGEGYTNHYGARRAAFSAIGYTRGQVEHEGVLVATDRKR